MKKILIACAFLVTTSISLVAKDFRNYIHEISPTVGMNFSDNRALVEDSLAFGINYNSYFSENFGLRLGYERFFAADVKGENQDTDVNRFYANLIYKMSNEYFRITPYFLAGMGYEAFEDKVISGGQWLIDVGVGLNVAINNRISIGPEIKAVRKSYSSDNMDVTAVLAFSFRFGLEPLAPKPTIKTVEKVIEKVVEKIVVKEVPVEKIVYRDRPVDVTTNDNQTHSNQDINETKKSEKVIEKVIEKEIKSQVSDNIPSDDSKDDENENDESENEDVYKNIDGHACDIPKSVKYNDRCDNSYYIQVSAALICKGCDDKFRNFSLIKKLDEAEYTHEIKTTIKDSGTRVDRLLVGPFKCKVDAFKELCNIKQDKIAPDAFIFAKTPKEK